MYKRCRYIKKKKIFVMIALLGIIMMFGVKWVLTTSPKMWVKKQTIVVYRWVYGDEHRIKLHEHLSFLYGDIDEEIEEYQNHDY